MTFEQYTKFAHETGYALLKGKHNKSLTIDRIDPKKGYHIDNIRCVRMITNARLAYTKMPGWMIEEMLKAEAGGIVEEVAALREPG